MSAKKKQTKKQQGVDYYLESDGLDSARERDIGQHIGYRYDVNLVPDYSRLTPFLVSYIEAMGWLGDIWNLTRSSRAIMSRSCWLSGSSMSSGTVTQPLMLRSNTAGRPSS